MGERRPEMGTRRRRGFVRFFGLGLTGGTRARRPGCCFVGVTLQFFVLMLCFALGASDIIVSGLVAFFFKKNHSIVKELDGFSVVRTRPTVPAC